MTTAVSVCPSCNSPLDVVDHSTDCPEGRAGRLAAAADPAPKTRTVPVWRYFIAYEAEMPHRRERGNQVLNLPAPIGSQAAVNRIQDLIAAHAKFQTHGIVGNRPRITLTAVDLLETFAMTETITAEGEAAGEGEAGDSHADQHTES